MGVPDIPDWREKILAGVGAPTTPENLRFMDAWARSEGGSASNNPFNTTLRTSGSVGNYNNLGSGIGVQNYASVQDGIDATVNTLTNGRYANIIGALRSGDNAMTAAQALAASPWGTGALVEKVLGGAQDFQTVTGGSGTGLPQLPGDPNALAAPGAPGANPNTPLANALTPFLSGGAPSATQPQPGATPGQMLQQRFSQIQQHTAISPMAVALMANLGDATKAVTAARSNTDDMLYGFNPENQPVVRTLGTLQTGSTDSKYKTLDLGQDFDGPIHPNAAPIVDMAKKYLGTPYLWGGADPRKGFDCSGFVRYIYSQAGIAVGGTTYDQVKHGQAVKDVKNLLPGDVVFFSQDGDVHHEGLYIGGGQFIHAPHTGDVVKISSLSEPYYASQFLMGRRFIAPPGNPPA